MLTSFSVENYRAFADETTIELRPLTLLFGYNNAGKSALVRALALIADSTRSEYAMPLNLESPAARGAIYSELCSNLTGSRTIKLGLGFVGHDSTLQIRYEITQPAATFEHEIVGVHVDFAGSETVCFALTSVTSNVFSLSINGQEVSEAAPIVDFSGLMPTSSVFYDEGISLNDRVVCMAAMDCVVNELGKLRAESQWIGSLRKFDRRTIEYKGVPVRRLLPDGERVSEILVQDKLSNGRLLPSVSRWYEENFKRKLDVKQQPEKRFALTLEPLTVDVDRAVNLADTGEGIVQVLPVLVAAAMANRGGPTDPSIVAIEQPELHLHPAVHASLAKYLCDIAATKRPRMLVETHSENFLLGVQLQIVQKQISPDDVLIYWVGQEEDGSSYAQQITFDNEGYPRGFPESVFHEDLELARLLIELRDQVGT